MDVSFPIIVICPIGTLTNSDCRKDVCLASSQAFSVLKWYTAHLPKIRALKVPSAVSALRCDSGFVPEFSFGTIATRWISIRAYVEVIVTVFTDD